MNWHQLDATNCYDRTITATAVQWFRFYLHGCSWAGIAQSLRAGRSGDRIPVEARFSATVQTGPGAHPASCKMGTGSFPGVKRSGVWRWPPTPSSAGVKERVELYLYSTSGPSWPVIGWTTYLVSLHSAMCEGAASHINISTACSGQFKARKSSNSVMFSSHGLLLAMEIAVSTYHPIKAWGSGGIKISS